MGFQAWLGKTVVDSNLAAYKITMHMLMALFIVALLIYIVYSGSKSFIKTNKTFKYLILIGLFLTLIQIVLGTQVIQLVDEQAKVFAYDKSMWLDDIPLIYEYHRTFSILVISICSIFVTIVVSILPALKAAKLDPIKALKYE